MEYAFYREISSHTGKKKCPGKFEVCQKQEYASKQAEGNSLFIIKFSSFLVVGKVSLESHSLHNMQYL